MPLQDANPTPSFGGFGLSDRDQVVRVPQVVGVLLLPGRTPSPSAGVVGILQRYKVIDVLEGVFEVHHDGAKRRSMR